LGGPDKSIVVRPWRVAAKRFLKIPANWYLTLNRRWPGTFTSEIKSKQSHIKINRCHGVGRILGPKLNFHCCCKILSFIVRMIAIIQRCRIGIYAVPWATAQDMSSSFFPFLRIGLGSFEWFWLTFERPPNRLHSAINSTRKQFRRVSCLRQILSTKAVFDVPHAGHRA